MACVRRAVKVKYSVRLTAKAEADVESVLQWFYEQGAIAAGERWLGRLMAKLDTLETHPERASVAAESEDAAAPTQSPSVDFRRRIWW